MEIFCDRTIHKILTEITHFFEALVVPLFRGKKNTQSNTKRLFFFFKERWISLQHRSKIKYRSSKKEEKRPLSCFAFPTIPAHMQRGKNGKRAGGKNFLNRNKQEF